MLSVGGILVGCAVIAVAAAASMGIKRRRALKRVTAMRGAVRARDEELTSMKRELALTKKQADAMMRAQADLEAKVVNIDRFRIEYKRVHRRRKVGSGSFGDVWLSTYDGHDVAVKKLKTENIGEVSLKRFEAEVLMMSSLHHPNIVAFLGMVFEKPHICTF